MKSSKPIQYLIILGIIFLTFEIKAQKQANHWFTVDFHLDFNYNPVKIMPLTIPNSKSSQYSSISDYQGNLLFVTNNEIVYNSNFEPMPNGETGIQYNPANTINLNSLIVPRPGTGQFYIFLGGSKNSEISYVVVDLAKNNGLGDVVQKAKDLHIRTRNKIVATGNCSTFWVFMIQPIEDGPEKNRLLRFKIDKNGLDENPDTVNIEGIDYFSLLTFSPDGKSLVFLAENESNYSYDSKFRTVLYDFNIIDGSLSNPIFFDKGHLAGSYEFSNDCTKLYASSSSYMLNQFDLFQFDIRNRDSTAIEKSKAIIYQGDEDYYIQDMRLSPLGSIICELGTSYWWNKSSIIDFPNKSGIECSFRKDVLDFYIFAGHTNFVSTFLSPQFDENFDISAGESVETCSKSSIDLGEPPTFDIEYNWLPTRYLDKPKVAKPTFLYNDTISVKTDFQYILDAKNGYCHNTDTVKVTVYPDMHATVFGSKSVCPGVTEIDYWTKEDDRFRFEWTVDGGDLAGGQSTDSIKVNWGPTNSEASVTLTPYNELNCPSPPIKFPVRINVELQTETPIGDELLCSNLATGIPYQITNTNGSVYTWKSDYGNILNGQGTNKINIDWPGDGKYHLWVKEQSTTIDTVCYGVSDSLLVNLFTDSTKLEIDYAGVTREDPASYELQWFVSDTSRIIDDIQIFSTTELNPDWILKDERLKTENYLSFPDTTMNYVPMSFKISSVNGCQELVESEIHTSIFLEGIADSSSNSMTLTWTPYVGWDNIEQYEVWYSKDNEGQLIKVASFKPGNYLWTNSWGADAFDHHYRIRALHGSYPFESWSNLLTLSFDHPLEIPNVFTPNGDGINDTFDFPNLELYHENELQVYDRNGAEVYFKNDYDGGWTGGNLSAGVYYYSFTEKRNLKTYKGWVQILR